MGPSKAEVQKANEVLIHVTLGLKLAVAPAHLCKLAASLMFF